MNRTPSEWALVNPRAVACADDIWASRFRSSVVSFALKAVSFFVKAPRRVFAAPTRSPSGPILSIAPWASIFAASAFSLAIPAFVIAVSASLFAPLASPAVASTLSDKMDSIFAPSVLSLDSNSPPLNSARPSNPQHINTIIAPKNIASGRVTLLRGSPVAAPIIPKQRKNKR